MSPAADPNRNQKDATSVSALMTALRGVRKSKSYHSQEATDRSLQKKKSYSLRFYVYIAIWITCISYLFALLNRGPVFIMASYIERSATALNTFRSLFNELRKADKTFNRNSELYKYLSGEMRGHQVTQRQYAKSSRETEGLAKFYLSYLSSTRRLNELQETYKGGEKSIEESARIVGLQLPQRKN
ncbi:unnamed protein product [Caenorhabditis auriculariae]|uniref:Protein FMC1 homolog n=1 Tax=Caenorhabditis auriculariae TaxID=2777116 RepID=A0A8S1HNH4_9PELO|nr:unnamed protein product [Caenorhabditis auriculariae]